jgi:hypothetical protein
LGGLTKVAIPEPRRSNGGVPVISRLLRHITPLGLAALMIGWRTRLRQMMLLASARGKKTTFSDD